LSISVSPAYINSTATLRTSFNASTTGASDVLPVPLERHAVLTLVEPWRPRKPWDIPGIFYFGPEISVDVYFSASLGGSVDFTFGGHASVPATWPSPPLQIDLLRLWERNTSTSTTTAAADATSTTASSTAAPSSVVNNQNVLSENFFRPVYSVERVGGNVNASVALVPNIALTIDILSKFNNSLPKATLSLGVTLPELEIKLIAASGEWFHTSSLSTSFSNWSS
jgi:hypothetical protein